MRKTLLFTALAAAAGVCAAQDVGRVVASSPIYRQVEVPQQVCTTEEVQVQPSQWQPQQNCRSQSRIESRAVGYNVTYEYAGRRYDTQTSTPPGSTIPLQVTAMGVSSLAPPLASDGALASASGGGDGSQGGLQGSNGTYSTLQTAEPQPPVTVQPGVVVPTTTYSTVRRVVQPVPIVVQPAPVYVTPAYPAYGPAYGPGYGYGGGYGAGYGGGFYPGVSAWGGVPIGLSLNLGYSRGRWR